MLTVDRTQQVIIPTGTKIDFERLGKSTKRWSRGLFPKLRFIKVGYSQTASFHDHVIRLSGDDIDVRITRVGSREWHAEATYESNRFSARGKTTEKAL
jgi:hypothetical protein